MRRVRPFLRDPHGLVRAEAVAAYVDTSSRLSKDAARRLINDRDQLVRFQTLKALKPSVNYRNWAYELIDRRLRRERDDSVEVLAVEQLVRFDVKDEYLHRLLRAALAGRTGARWQAFRALQGLEGEVAVQRLASSAKEIPKANFLLSALRRMTPDGWIKRQ